MPGGYPNQEDSNMNVKRAPLDVTSQSKIIDYENLSSAEIKHYKGIDKSPLVISIREKNAHLRMISEYESSDGNFEMLKKEVNKKWYQ
jgi:hypothetical protein